MILTEDKHDYDPAGIVEARCRRDENRAVLDHKKGELRRNTPNSTHAKEHGGFVDI